MMEQWTLFPTVLQRKFLLTLLAGIASAGISVIICVATKDHILLALGIVVAYVSFFVDNPAYFQFLYSQSNIKIDLSLSIPDDQNYKPYIIYKNIVSKLLEQSHYPEEKQNDIIITIWAFIHGVTSLATMNNVNYDNDWREKVIDFMDVFQLPFIDNTGEKI